MSGPPEVPDIHPTLAAAARGELPGWSRMNPKRREHAGRVAELMGSWAQELGMRRRERARWRASGWLHDSLKDADADELRALLDGDFRGLPEPILHGPAAAARLEAEGVGDRDLLLAVTWHTLGHPGLDRLGMALYCADFLEPGRSLRNKWRKRLRDRMPADLEVVTRTILRERIRHLLKKRRPVRPETVGFWNRLAGGGDSWARASEL